jgi:hypothetical protein
MLRVRYLSRKTVAVAGSGSELLCGLSRSLNSIQRSSPSVPGKSVRQQPRHVIIDATGLQVYGAGEWHVRKQRVSRRRTWCKLHLGVDERTKEIVAVELTESRVHDSQPLPALLEQIADPIDQVSGDGAYDTRACYEAVLERGATLSPGPRGAARRLLC